jgi:Xaa-Pro aminopeptidase
MLESVLGAAALVGAAPVLMEQRARKTPDEQAALRLANDISTFGLAAFEQSADIGVSGVELVAAVERAVMLEETGYRGARGVRSFAQVATGPEETSVGYRPIQVSTRPPLAARLSALGTELSPRPAGRRRLAERIALPL